MDTIETPKIDRLHRLGAVSLTVRAGGGEEMGQLTGRTVLPPLSWQALSRPFLPAAGTASCLFPVRRHPSHAASGYEGSCTVG